MGMMLVLYLCDLGSLKWHRITVEEGEVPEARSGHVAAVVDKKMYMFGGQSEDGRMLDDLWVLHLTKCKYQCCYMLYQMRRVLCLQVIGGCLEGDVDYTARWYQVEPVPKGPPALMNASWVKHNDWELIL